MGANGSETDSLQDGIQAGDAVLAEHERKFLVTPDDGDAFLDAVSPWTTPDVFDAAGPFSWTRTTYLDTDDFAWFRDSTRGERARKLRVRQYASAPTAATAPLLGADCFLELKESGGETRSKVRFRAAPAMIAELVRSGGDISIDAPPSEAFELLRRILRRHRPSPRVTTWYRRESRSGADGRVRVTVDSSVVFARPELPGTPGAPAVPANPIASFPFHIVEIKYTGDAPSWLAAAAETLPASTGFSKFREGMSCLGIRL